MTVPTEGLAPNALRYPDYLDTPTITGVSSRRAPKQKDFFCIKPSSREQFRAPKWTAAAKLPNPCARNGIDGELRLTLSSPLTPRPRKRPCSFAGAGRSAT